MTNPIVHFELPVDDMDRAQAFYTDIFGWKINKFEMPADGSTGGEPYYGVITSEVDDKGVATSPGAINGGMMKRANPGQVFTNYIQVDSIDVILEKIQAKGGQVMMPKTEIAPGMGWIALFMDSEKNVMGLHEMPESMKKS